MGDFFVLPPGACNIKVVIKKPVPGTADPLEYYTTAGVKWNNGY
jgi:hypothetical protein